MFIFLVLTLLSNLHSLASYQTPFSTSGNQIIDASGATVRLRCVNWPGSMETLMPEGLQHNSIDNIVQLIKQMNMTCVRLTYSIDAARTENLTVYQSLSRLKLDSALQGFMKFNENLINRTTLEIFDAVLDQLGRANIFVLIDNHISKAMWCCSDVDGNGFWGDRYFDVASWVDGVRTMARKTIGRPYVIAMSLRNELRGLRQNVPDWYQNILIGLHQAVASVNPDLLIVISGLSYDLDLSFIREKPIQQLVLPSVAKKIVYEAHWYSWSNYGHSTECSKMKDGIMSAWGFILDLGHNYTAPVWLTEFGTDVDHYHGNDTFIECVKSFLQTDRTSNMSWSYWVLVGTYYLRSGAPESHESFGLLTDDWQSIKSKSFIDLLSSF